VLSRWWRQPDSDDECAIITRGRWLGSLIDQTGISRWLHCRRRLNLALCEFNCCITRHRSLFHSILSFVCTLVLPCNSVSYRCFFFRCSITARTDDVMLSDLTVLFPTSCFAKSSEQKILAFVVFHKKTSRKIFHWHAAARQNITSTWEVCNFTGNHLVFALPEYPLWCK